MRNIRTGVFETNSSSTHSISISENTDGILDTIVPTDDGVIILSGGEYGWSWEKFNDPLSKANYCALDLQKDPASLTMLVDVIMQHTGAKKIVLSLDGYIDHQSSGTSESAVVNSEVLKNFIFNSQSWLFTGNDNDHAPPNFYDTDKDIIYTHQLSISGVTEIAKFTSLPNLDSEKFQEIVSSLIENHPLCGFIDSNNEPHRIVSWECLDVNGKHFSSWDSLKDGLITVYKTKTVYSKDKGKYIGEAIKSSRQIPFKIIEL